MNIEERKETTETLNNAQTVDLFKSIVMGKEITEILKTSRGDFKVKYPRARDIEEIGRKTAWRLNGIPVRCFDADTYNLMNYIATLDVIVMDGPDWYRLAQKNNVNFSWADMPDQDFILEVYAKAYSFRTEVQDKIKRDQKQTDQRVATVSSSDDYSQSGLFENMSGDTGING